MKTLLMCLFLVGCVDATSETSTAVLAETGDTCVLEPPAPYLFSCQWERLDPAVPAGEWLEKYSELAYEAGGGDLERRISSCSTELGQIQCCTYDTATRVTCCVTFDPSTYQVVSGCWTRAPVSQ